MEGKGKVLFSGLIHGVGQTDGGEGAREAVDCINVKAWAAGLRSGALPETPRDSTPEIWRLGLGEGKQSRREKKRISFWLKDWRRWNGRKEHGE